MKSPRDACIAALGAESRAIQTSNRGRPSVRWSLAAAFALAAGCGLVVDPTTEHGNESLELVDAPPAGASGLVCEELSSSTCDGPEADLGIEWEASLEEAMKRGQAEDKPVLIVFSARRQESCFEQEF